MSVKTRAAITSDITADYLTGSAGNISATDLRKGLNNLNESKANVIIAALDCSSNPNYPASERGDIIPVSTTGKIGGSSGKIVFAGDIIVCLSDSSGGTETAEGSKFYVLNNSRFVANAELESKYTGSQTVMMTDEEDLTTTFDTTLTIPSGYTFFPTECFLVITDAATVSVQPTVRFGNSGTPASLIAAVATTGLTAAAHRQRFTTLVTATGQTSLSGGVTSGATASTLQGRFGFIGMLIKDQ